MTTSNSELTTARRDFLRWAGALAAGAGLSGLASAQTATDYKALVCVFLLGGNDGHNTIVPTSTAAYAAYKSIRGGLSLPDTNTQLIGVTTAGGATYGLNSGLQAVAPFWSQGKLAVMANVGTLARPTTRAEIVAGTAVLPSQLYSHSDQIAQQQAGNANGGGTGWGGRCADAVQTLNGTSRFPPSVSLSGSALYCSGSTVQAASLIPGFNLSQDGLSSWPSSAAAARLKGLQDLTGIDAGIALVKSANQVRADAITLNQLLAGSGGATLATTFPGTSLGQQLKQVAQFIKLRGTLGMSRQVFFTSIGGFDTHSSQSWAQWDLLTNVAEAMAAFYNATVELGVANQVTTFTQSDFGRTLQPSGSGSDHGWGNHHLILGGSVKGGNVYGQFPFPALGGNDDAGNRGALIPSTSLEQFGATLGKWFGVSSAQMAAAFPNLSLFPVTDLGFMG